MARLDPSDGYTVLINTFKVEPEHADELVALLASATEETMRHLPGFISANLHVALDRKHVANYAQWRSRDDFEAMLKNEAAKVHMELAKSIASAFEPILYELRFSESEPAEA
jgi:quinol monooxygenase YgiN